MSPKGLNAPPALAATTIFTQPIETKVILPAPTVITTAAITSAVVRLSATGEMTKASAPVIQKTVRSVKPEETNQARIAWKTLRSSMVLM